MAISPSFFKEGGRGSLEKRVKNKNFDPLFIGLKAHIFAT